MAFLPAVLSPEGLKHLAEHKYVAGKLTPLDKLLTPLWERLVNILPMWLAPNLVTMLGFLPMMLSFTLAWINDPHFSEPPSRLLALYTALSTLVYQTLDALDGKQARRTGSSSPLGQLFDHGCDCLACLSHHSVAGMVLLPGGCRLVAAGLVALQTAFFLAQWQEYHTGVLRTSFGPVGVTETQFALILLALTAAIAGPATIKAVAHHPVKPPWASEPLAAGSVAIFGWIAFMACLATVSFCKTMSHVVKTKGAAGLTVAVRQLVPIAAVLVILFFVWDTSVFVAHSRKLCFLTGIQLFFLTAQIVLFSMAKMPFPTFQVTLVPYAMVAILSRFLSNEHSETAMLLTAFGLGLWIFLWLSRVLQEVTTKLGICTFKITPKAENGKTK